MMKTILIVDDEERIRRVYGRMFTKEGFKVLEARSAVDADDVMLRSSVDLILLDINMPEVSGAMLYDLIQAFHRKAKVIVSSVYSLDEQKSIITGATDYYDKSESIQILLCKVKAALQENQKKKKILIIDDEAGIRSLFRRHLKMAGYQTLEAKDGSGALESLRANKDVELVVLDILLPKESGSDVFDIIKKEFPQIKIIISSVHPKDEQEFLIFDADDYYCKTDSINALVDKINQLLSV